MSKGIIMDVSKNSKVYYGRNSVKNERIDNQARIHHSGNSDVDVNVNIEIDTMAIAYALLCSSLAKQDLTNEQFEFALNKLQELTKKEQKNKNNRNSGQWDKLIYW
jgi:hypothetical protein